MSVMMTSSGFIYDEHGFQNSTAFANDFQSEAATLGLHLNRCSYTFVVSELQFASVLLFELNCICQWFSKQSSSINNNFAKN